MSDYKTENVWLMKGDCLERMKEIPSGSVDMVLTCPIAQPRYSGRLETSLHPDSCPPKLCRFAVAAASALAVAAAGSMPVADT